MHAYRFEHCPALTQAALGRWMNMTQAQVSRLENSTKSPSDLDKLAAWASALHIPESVLWFKFPTTTGKPASENSESVGTFLQSKFRWFSDCGKHGIPKAHAESSITVASIRETTSALRALDNRFGGGHARAVVSAYLDAEVAPTMHSFRPSRENADFVSAVAELNQLAGWMAYDVGDTRSGQRHLQAALKLCQRIGDQALSAEMLAGMSHQAAHSRHGSASIELARAARELATGTGIGALISEAAVMEAHGLALIRDKRGCVAALNDAESSFGRADRHDCPQWLSYYDTAYLAAKMAHCMRELGDLHAAKCFARRSLEMNAGYDRGKLFNTALLASILADLQEIEEACAVGRDALQLGRRLQSARTRVYLQDFTKRLQQHEAPAARALTEELKSMGIT